MHFPAPQILLAMAAAIPLTHTAAPAQQSQDAAVPAKLAGALSGRVPGPAQRCITKFRTTKVRPIDDATILYDQGSTIFVQKPPGGCPGLTNGNYALETRSTNDQMCAGDANDLVNLQTGLHGPVCIFGEFVPYTKPAG